MSSPLDIYLAHSFRLDARRVSFVLTKRTIARTGYQLAVIVN